MEIKQTSKYIERNKISPIKYKQLHATMFESIEEYMKNVYPDYECSGIKIVAHKK